MSKATAYMLTVRAIARIESAQLGFAGLRLLHALLAVGAQMVQAVPHQQLAPRPPRLEVLTSELLRAGYPEGTRDLRTLRRGLVELADPAIAARLGQAIVAHLEHHDASRLVHWQFGSSLLHDLTLRQKEGFGMVDPDVIRTCRTPAQMLHATRLAQVQGLAHPTWRLPVLEEGGALWDTAARRAWVCSAGRFSVELESSHLFIPRIDRHTGRTVAVDAKVTHPRTTWSEGRLYNSEGAGRMVAVVAGVARGLDRHEVARRRAWRFVDRP